MTRNEQRQALKFVKRKNTIEQVCNGCGRLFYLIQCEAKNNKHCSAKCYLITKASKNKKMLLSKGVMIDLQDDHLLNNGCWITEHGYVSIPDKKSGKYLHREIMGVTDSKITVDHKNGNRLDNRRENLRVCVQSENTLNKRIRSDNVSGEHGVWLRKNTNKWAVQISKNGERIGLGCYASKDEAIQVRRKYDLDLFGEYSSLEGVRK
jgi:hypothetical protein